MALVEPNTFGVYTLLNSLLGVYLQRNSGSALVVGLERALHELGRCSNGQFLIFELTHSSTHYLHMHFNNFVSRKSGFLAHLVSSG